MEIVKFILSGFWTWAGAIGLTLIIAAAIIAVIKVNRDTRKITAYRIGSRWHVQIEGARRGDIDKAIKLLDTSGEEQPPAEEKQ